MKNKFKKEKKPNCLFLFVLIILELLTLARFKPLDPKILRKRGKYAK